MKPEELHFRMNMMREFNDLQDIGKCPVCKRDMENADFTSPESEKEYMTTGLCQECQDLLSKMYQSDL